MPSPLLLRFSGGAHHPIDYLRLQPHQRANAILGYGASTILDLPLAKHRGLLGLFLALVEQRQDYCV